MGVGKIGSRDTELGGVGKQASLRGQPAPRPAGRGLRIQECGCESHGAGLERKTCCVAQASALTFHRARSGLF